MFRFRPFARLAVSVAPPLLRRMLPQKLPLAFYHSQKVPVSSIRLNIPAVPMQPVDPTEPGYGQKLRSLWNQALYTKEFTVGIEYFNGLVELGEATPQDWNRVIYEFSFRNLHSLALKAYDNMQARGVPPDYRTCTAAMNAALSRQHLDAGDPIITELLRLDGGKMLETTLNMCIRYYNRTGKPDKAAEYLKKLPPSLMNHQYWHVAFSVWVTALTPPQLLEKFESLLQTGLMPDSLIFSYVMEGFASNLEFWGKFIRLLDKYDIGLSLRLLTTAVNKLLEHNNAAAAEALLERFVSSGETPDDIFLHSIYRYWEESGQPSKTDNLREALAPRLLGEKLSADKYVELSRAYKVDPSKIDLDKALAERGPREFVDTWNLLLKIAVERNDVRSITKIIQASRSQYLMSRVTTDLIRNYLASVQDPNIIHSVLLKLPTSRSRSDIVLSLLEANAALLMPVLAELDQRNPSTDLVGAVMRYHAGLGNMSLVRKIAQAESRRDRSTVVFWEKYLDLIQAHALADAATYLDGFVFPAIMQPHVEWLRRKSLEYQADPQSAPKLVASEDE